MKRSGEAKNPAVLDFQQLESIRIFSKEILRDQETSLSYFEFYPGFQHFRGKQPPRISVSSSATCVLSLVATGKWKDTSRNKALLKKILSRKKSAGLEDNNPFTVAWILEAVESLKSLPISFDNATKARTVAMDTTLQNALRKGGVRIEPYPPSAYLTQLVVRVLARRSRLTPSLKKAVNEWAWAELARQLALVQAKSKTQDAFAVCLSANDRHSSYAKC